MKLLVGPWPHQSYGGLPLLNYIIFQQVMQVLSFREHINNYCKSYLHHLLSDSIGLVRKLRLNFGISQ